MIKYTELVKEWSRINEVTDNLAEVVSNIRQRMEGRGISPAEAPIIMAKLQQVEDRLRQIGSSSAKLIPDASHINVPLEL